MYIYGNYHKIKTGVPLFWTTQYISSVDNAESNGLAFWQRKSAAFPLLAIDLLSALASQAYMERGFSVCGDLTSSKRNRLFKALENRAFGKVNLKYYA